MRALDGGRRRRGRGLQRDRGSTVAVPVIAYLAARERMAPVLAELKEWLEANNVAVMSVLLLVIGMSLLGKGIGGLL